MWWGEEQLKTSVSREEYLRLERQNEFWSEYIDGVMIEMPASHINHVTIRSNLTTEIGMYLKEKPCHLMGRMRVRVNEKHYNYPDFLIVCAELELEDEHKDSLLNPETIIEVFSPITEAYDRGDKFATYRELKSFREYVLVSQSQPLVEQYIRQASGSWKFLAIQGLDASVRLESVQCTLALNDVYRRVKFVEGEEQRAEG